MSLIARLFSDQRAQNTFEYLLVGGVVVVLIVSVMIAGFQLLIPQLVGHVCPAVDTGFPTGSPAATPGSCVGP